MSRTILPAPIRKTVQVKTTPDRAFEFFARRMGQWWRKDHSILKETPQVDIVVEPRVGGRWFERGVDGSECDWGRVLAWEPPSRLVLSWQIDGNWVFNPDLLTEVEIRFIADGVGATRVELVHSRLEGFGELVADTRAALDSPGGWTGALERFKEMADNLA